MQHPALVFPLRPSQFYNRRHVPQLSNVAKVAVATASQSRSLASDSVVAQRPRHEVHRLRGYVMVESDQVSALMDVVSGKPTTGNSHLNSQAPLSPTMLLLRIL